jgi:hypothetical protein
MFLGERPNPSAIYTMATSEGDFRYEPRRIRPGRGTSLVHPSCSQPLDVRLKLFDLRFQTLAMRAVLCCIDRFTLEGRVFEPQGIDLATKPIVLGVDTFIFPVAHVAIVARCGRMVEP